MHLLFGYTTDLVIALTGLGLTTPLLALLGSTGEKEAAATPSLSAILGSVPSWLCYPTGALVVIWIVLRLAFNREEGQKRAVLAKSCTQVLREAEANLATALGKPDPMPALNELLEKSIRPTVDRNIQENSWPWTPFAPGIDEEVEREVSRLCATYEADWLPVNPLGLQQANAGGTV